MNTDISGFVAEVLDNSTEENEKKSCWSTNKEKKKLLHFIRAQDQNEILVRFVFPFMQLTLIRVDDEYWIPILKSSHAVYQ